MTLAISLIGLWVLLGAIWLAVWPLLADAGPAPTARELERHDLEAEKDRLLGEIHELELDHATGKLSSDDFTALEARLKGRAVEVMERLEEPPGATSDRSSG